MSTERRTLGVYSRKRPLGPNGERLCYNCGGPLPKMRRFNCSPACSEEWRGKTSPAHMRYLVLQRDKGICALCGTDCVALKQMWTQLHGRDEARLLFLSRHGIPPSRSSSVFWDADHITPVVEGGGGCGLSKHRTLCIPCHQEETARLAARLAESRSRAAIEKAESVLTRPVFGDEKCIEARDVLRAKAK